MIVKTHIPTNIFARRFLAGDPRYAMLVSHGIGGHSDIYNAFCEHHSAKRFDV